MQKLSLDLLKNCKIEENKITLKTTGPTYLQKDNYACGDFTCAYTHKKVKEFCKDSGAYNQEYINVLEQKGNEQEALRHKTREISEELIKKPRSEVRVEKQDVTNSAIKQNVTHLEDLNQSTIPEELTVPMMKKRVDLTQPIVKGKVDLTQPIIKGKDWTNYKRQMDHLRTLASPPPVAPKTSSKEETPLEDMNIARVKIR